MVSVLPLTVCILTEGHVLALRVLLGFLGGLVKIRVLAFILARLFSALLRQGILV
jgi:hypothetical protein